MRARHHAECAEVAKRDGAVDGAVIDDHRLCKRTFGRKLSHCPESTCSTKKHTIPDELVAQLLGNYQKPEDLIGENGLLKQLTKLLVEKALEAEMAYHLGHDKHEPALLHNSDASQAAPTPRGLQA